MLKCYCVCLSICLSITSKECTKIECKNALSNIIFSNIGVKQNSKGKCVVAHFISFMADSNCLHVNSGGKDITIKENGTTFSYEGDGEVEGGAAKYFINEQSYWGFSSTGDFMDDNDYQNTRYIVTLQSSNISELYSTARISPISLTYFHYCLENGKYTVNLHFVEILFSNDQTYNSLGKRIFDIYIQVSSRTHESIHL